MAAKGKVQDLTAVYAGSFDPPTLGHLNIVQRAAPVFGELIVAVAESTSKRYVFSTAERVELWKRLIPAGVKNVRVDTFSGLLVNYCDRVGARVLLRGLRNIADFEYELSMAHTNQAMRPEVETMFMMTDGSLSHLSSSLIKEIVILGGSVTGMVPPLVEEELKKKIGATNQI